MLILLKQRGASIAKTTHPLNRNPLDLVERDLVAGPVVEFGLVVTLEPKVPI